MFSITYGIRVRIVTLLFLLILIGLPVYLLTSEPVFSQMRRILIVGTSIIVLFASLYFVVTGFELKNTELVIRRVGKNINIPLKQIENVTFIPNAIRGSFRIFGIGGVFGYYGSFSNFVIGDYTAYATNIENTVVIKLKRETIVVTPDSPQEFTFKIKKYM